MIALLVMMGELSVQSWAANNSGDFSLRDRVAKNPSLTSTVTSRFSAAGKRALEDLCDYADTLGHMPSLTEFLDRECNPPTAISWDDFCDLWFVFVGAQDTSGVKKELLALFKARPNCVETIDIRYDTAYIGGLNDGMNVENRFAMDGQKLFYESITRSAASHASKDQWCMYAYDLDMLRTCSGRGTKRLGGVATIEPLSHISRFFPEGNPLLRQHFFNSPNRFGLDVDSLGKTVASMGVYETREQFADQDCLVIGGTVEQYYLAPKLNYALVGILCEAFTFDKQHGRLVKQPQPTDRQVSSEFVDCSNGIWLPKRIERTTVGDDRTVFREDTTISEYLVNKEIAATVFTDVIPDGATVADRINNKTYITGETARLEECTALSCRLRSRTWLVTANVLALIFCMGLLVYRKRRQKATAQKTLR